MGVRRSHDVNHEQPETGDREPAVQIIARSTPSNHASTHGSVLTRTSATDSRSTDSGAEQLPKVASNRNTRRAQSDP